MTLGELIRVLEAAAEAYPGRELALGFGSPHSYRGYYEDLAFAPGGRVTVAEALESAKGALGSTYEGWKGGEYTMGEYTDCWLAQEGESRAETIGPVLLSLLLSEPPLWASTLLGAALSDAS